MITPLSLSHCPSQLTLSCSEGDKNSCFFPVLLSRQQVFSLLSDDFLLNLCSDDQVPCVCQAGPALKAPGPHEALGHAGWMAGLQVARKAIVPTPVLGGTRTRAPSRH